MNDYTNELMREINARKHQLHASVLREKGRPITGAIQFVEKLPHGLDTALNPWIEDVDGTPGVDFSGGQWQRLALVRNFYRDAPVIILDEPTSAIDALAESRIFKQLFANKDKTIIAASHRLTTIKKADVVYMMQDGQIVEQGTCDALIARKGAFYHMFEPQL